MYFRPLAAHYVLTIVATLAYVLLYLFFERVASIFGQLATLLRKSHIHW